MSKPSRGSTLAGLVLTAGLALASDHASAQHRSLFSFEAPSGATPSGLARGRDGTLYGVTRDGGAFGKGAVVAVTRGVGRPLYSFRGAADGASPAAVVLGSDGALYGLSSLLVVDAAPQSALFKVTSSGAFSVLAKLQGGEDSLRLALGQDGVVYVSSGQDAAVLAVEPSGRLRRVFEFEAGTWANTLLALRRGELYGTTQSASGPSLLFRVRNGALSELARLPQGPDGSSTELATALARTGDGTLVVATLGGASPALYTQRGSGRLRSLGPLDAPASALTLAPNGADVIGATRFGGAAQRGSLFRVARGRVSTLASFSGREGAAPNALISSTSAVYGSAADGGGGGFGSYFRYSDTSGLSTVYSFTYPDGARPTSLVLGSDGALYGTTQDGGEGGAGSVFRADKSGALSTLHAFSGPDGAAPQNLIEGSDGALYGRTLEGGSAGQGSVFKLSKDGELTPLLDFTEYGQSRGPALVQLADGSLYGADQAGSGHIFRIRGAGQRDEVHSFTGLETREGANPSALVAGPDGVIYGLTRGAYGPLIPPQFSSGTVFRLNAAGQLDTLYAFSDDANALGAMPRALVLGAEGALYGATSNISFLCGVHGALWKLDPAAPNATELRHAFTGRDDGTGPASLLQTEDGRFFGLTAGGTGPQNDSGSMCGVRNSTLFELTASGVRTLERFAFQIGASAAVEQSGTLIDGRDGKLYGTLANGGSSNSGELFAFDVPPPAAAP